MHICKVKYDFARKAKKKMLIWKYKNINCPASLKMLEDTNISLEIARREALNMMLIRYHLKAYNEYLQNGAGYIWFFTTRLFHRLALDFLFDLKALKKTTFKLDP